MWNTSSPSSLLWSSLVPSWSHSHVTHLGYSGSPPHSSTCVHHCCYAFHQELLTFLAGGAFEVPGDPASSPPTPRTRLPCSLYSTNLLSVPQTRRAASPPTPHPRQSRAPFAWDIHFPGFPQAGASSSFWSPIKERLLSEAFADHLQPIPLFSFLCCICHHLKRAAHLFV